MILDLEDAVPDAEKENARKAIADAAKLPRKTRLYIRINALSTPHGLDPVPDLPNWCQGPLAWSARAWITCRKPCPTAGRP